MGNKNTITISRAEYEKFIRDSEKIAVLLRFVDSDKYINSNDILTILGIERKESNE